MLKTLITDEQILEVALEAQEARDYDMEGTSGEIVTLYCMIECGIGSSAEVLKARIEDLLASHIKTGLANKGILDPDYSKEEICYTITPLGRKLLGEQNGK